MNKFDLMKSVPSMRKAKNSANNGVVWGWLLAPILASEEIR